MNWKESMSRTPKLSNRDPFEILAARVVTQALEDLHSWNPILNLDAVLFFLGEEAQIYMNYLGYEFPDEQLFLKILRGFEHVENPKTDQRDPDRNRRDEHPGKAQIPERAAA
jgi:hypothetical protein